VKTNFLKAAKVVWFSSTQGLQAEYFEQPKVGSYLHWCSCNALGSHEIFNFKAQQAACKRFSVTEILFLKSV
jgi:hypothetical protein